MLGAFSRHSIAEPSSEKTNENLKKIEDWFQGVNKKKVIFAVNAGADKSFQDDSGI